MSTAHNVSEVSDVIDSSKASNTPNVIDQASGENWQAYHGDCVEVARGLPDRSVALSVFSPPFASLYTYSNSPRDMGNVRDDEEFFAHFDFLVIELARVMMRGRIVAFHCMDMPSAKSRDGHIGLRDFPGDLIRAFEKTGWCAKCGAASSRSVHTPRASSWMCERECGSRVEGFHFHSRVTIWKDPVTAMQRTKALGLLHKTVRENASMSRVGIPDYVIAMRAPGDVPVEERVKHTIEEYPVDRWQQIASPVWAVTTAEGVKAAIDPQDTLQHHSVREHDDERHICPLQLEVILRCVELWTNPGEVVFSPYMGIASEGHVALGGATRAGRRLEKPRKFVGAELKASYFKQAVANLRAASCAPRQTSIFDVIGRAGGTIESAAPIETSPILGASGARMLRETLAADVVEDAFPASQEPAQGPAIDGAAVATVKPKRARKTAKKGATVAAQETLLPTITEAAEAPAVPTQAPEMIGTIGTAAEEDAA